MNTVGISSNDKYLLLLIGNVGYGNLQPSFLFYNFIKSNISAIDALVAVKFHTNIANRWLL